MRIKIALLQFLGTFVLAQYTNTTAIPYAVKAPPLTTDWTYKVGTNPWPEYPRPQLERSQWQNLNGIWTYQNASALNATTNPPFGQTLKNEVLVPSCLESGLSGIQGEFMIWSWFKTSFTVPSSWPKENRVLLNFGAVDYEATVYVNGKKMGFNRGGYYQFTVDITYATKPEGKNELLVFVHDPTDGGDYIIPIGKQTLSPSDIFYRPCSGIWQSVWIESAPIEHVANLDLDADMNGQVNLTVHSSTGAATPVSISVFKQDSTKVVATANFTSDSPFQFTVSSPSLWSPSTPTLYNISVTLGTDTIRSYTGFRTISSDIVDGIQRPLLNGEFTFMLGTLDQGFWPDGLYTPPNREAMVYDLQTLKDLGFNMLRKHIKVENALFYQACDQMGLMLIQDMPALPTNKAQKVPNAAQQTEFERQLEVLVRQLRSYPSIVTWVIYNEGWGQITSPYYPEFGLTDLVRSLDPTRLIDSTSGWYDHGAGDYSGNHHYANPQCGTPFYSINSSAYDPQRIGFQGEFGGLGQNVSIGHLWNVQGAIDTINQIYELDLTLDAWRYRSHLLLDELRQQIEMYSCSGAVWTQTTDVEGEVNGLLTYDRRILRCGQQWKDDIKGLFDAAARRRNGTAATAKMF